MIALRKNLESRKFEQTFTAVTAQTETVSEFLGK